MKSCYLIFLLVVFAFLVRISYPIYLEMKNEGYHERNINEIEFYYDDVARSIVAGKGFVHSENPNKYTKFKFEPGTPFNFVPPLYALLVAFVYKIFGPNVLYAKIITSLFDALVCLYIYLICKQIFHNRKLGLLASALYSVYPFAIYMASIMYYQTLLNLCLCIMVFCLLKARANWRNGAACGVAFGLSALAKPVTLPLIIFLPFIKFLEYIFKKIACDNFIQWTAFFVFAGVVVLLPWTVRNYIVFHEFVPVQKGGPAAFFQGSREEYIDVDVDTLRVKFKEDFSDTPSMYKRGFDNHIHQLVDSPMAYLAFLVKKFAYSWFNTEGKTDNTKALLVQSPFLLMALIGFVSALKMWFRNFNYYIFIIVMFIVGVQVLYFPLVRYTLSVMPLMMIYSSVGIYFVMNLFNRRYSICAEFK